MIVVAEFVAEFKDFFSTAGIPVLGFALAGAKRTKWDELRAVNLRDVIFLFDSAACGEFLCTVYRALLYDQRKFSHLTSCPYSRPTYIDVSTSPCKYVNDLINFIH